MVGITRRKVILVFCYASPGRFREERSIDEKGQLHFKLQGLEENSTAWGRTFKRKGLLDDWWAMVGMIAHASFEQLK